MRRPAQDRLVVSIGHREAKGFAARGWLPARLGRLLPGSVVLLVAATIGVRQQSARLKCSQFVSEFKATVRDAEYRLNYPRRRKWQRLLGLPLSHFHYDCRDAAERSSHHPRVKDVT